MDKKYFWGIIFIVFGILGIINQIFSVNLFSSISLWPLFILVPGLCFEFSYFSTKKIPGVLVPGGILTTIGLLFIFETITNWKYATYTWPIYILAPAIGLFQFYFVTKKDRSLLITAVVLTIIAIVSFISMIFGNVFIWFKTSIILPIILLLVGVYIVFNKDK